MSAQCANFYMHISVHEWRQTSNCHYFLIDTRSLELQKKIVSHRILFTGWHNNHIPFAIKSNKTLSFSFKFHKLLSFPVKFHEIKVLIFSVNNSKFHTQKSKYIKNVIELQSHRKRTGSLINE